ncbi:Rv1733c family protein [Streptomyces malaysiensis]|uniref:Rv1733c family protein n=1 Tax=Streptomyces malaysiensis TaxID=92644 RepID=UPI00371BD2D2
MNTHGPRRVFGPRPPLRRRPAGGPNPLRRRTDRIQTWCTVLFVLILAVGLPAAAISAGYAAHASQMRVVAAETSARHQITARLAEATPGPDHSDVREPRQARVRWVADDGERHTGTATLADGGDSGDEVRVWVNHEGALAQPPSSPSTARSMGWFTGCLTAAAVAAVALTGRARVRRALDRGRYARWEAEWKVVEPAWSGRNRR